MWTFSDEELEGIHDFIQWMFPLRQPSQFDPDAPLLTDDDIAQFHSDPKLGVNLLRSFGVFLTFLGLRFENERVQKAPDFEAKKGVWLYPNHNWLRISRVLESIRVLGLKKPGRAFFDFLKTYRESGQSGITAESFRYWEKATKAENPD